MRNDYSIQTDSVSSWFDHFITYMADDPIRKQYLQSSKCVVRFLHFERSALKYVTEVARCPIRFYIQHVIVPLITSSQVL